jgi:ParB family chromosome partitioning protein
MSLKDKANKITFGRGDMTAIAVPPVKDAEPRTKTAPGAMMAYANDRRSELVKENDELKAKVESVDRLQARLDDTIAELRLWDGATATRLIDTKMVVDSRYANRDERSFTDESFQALKAEIESAGGNVQAIKVRPQKEGGKFEIVFGHRRHRACMELALPVLAMVENLDDKALFVEMDRENRNRKDLSAWEQGVMYKKALEEGLFSSLGKLCEASGCHKGNASTAIALAELPKEVVAAFPSPNDLQFRWAKPLKDACANDMKAVLAAAIKIARDGKKLNAAAVFLALTSTTSAGPFYGRTPAAPVNVLVGKLVVATIGVNAKGKTQVHIDSLLDSVKAAELSEFLQKLLKS